MDSRHIHSPHKQRNLITGDVDNQELTFENAAKILLNIKAQFDKANIPFQAIDLSMRTDGEHINFDNFPYEDIYEEGLEDRIKTAHDALESYYVKQDGK